MCGRFAVFSSPGDLARLFDVDEIATDPLPERYNVAPTLEVYAIIQHRTERRLGTLRWGLVPHWVKDAKTGPINARAETLDEKPSFRDAFARRRCLIPADGFYEWRTDPATEVKTPYFIRRRDGRPMAFAGLWEAWRPSDDPGAAPLYTCAIVTTAADGFLEDLHPRMPVVLDADERSEWLDEDTSDTGRLRHLLAPHGADALEAHPVAPIVNDVRNEGPELISPLRR